jgi:hypothetical protein
MAYSNCKLIEEVTALDKNETKNIVIIMLTVFLAFSVILNAFYYIENHSVHPGDNLGNLNRKFVDKTSSLNPFNLPTYRFCFAGLQIEEIPPA